MNLPTVEFITICDHALISKDNKLSIMGIFDRIFLSKLPTQYPRFFLVAILVADPATTHQINLKFTSPSGQLVLPEKTLSVTFATNGKANLLTDISNLKLAEIGAYQFSISSESSLLSQTSLHINRLSENNKSLPN